MFPGQCSSGGSRNTTGAARSRWRRRRRRGLFRLSPTQLSKLYAIITGSDPRQLQFDFGLWTRKIIRELIRREFGVKFSEVQVGRLLKKMGLSPQRPLYRAYQQDPERVAEWKKSVYPKIRKLAAEEGASIFFADEASIRTDHHAGTTWRPPGRPRSSSRPVSGRRSTWYRQFPRGVSCVSVFRRGG